MRAAVHTAPRRGCPLVLTFHTRPRSVSGMGSIRYSSIMKKLSHDAWPCSWFLRAWPRVLPSRCVTQMGVNPDSKSMCLVLSSISSLAHCKFCLLCVLAHWGSMRGPSRSRRFLGTFVGIVLFDISLSGRSCTWVHMEAMRAADNEVCRCHSSAHLL